MNWSEKSATFRDHARSGLAAFIACTPLLAIPIAPSVAQAPPAKAPPAPVFRPSERAVSTWRDEAADHLVLTADQVAAFRGTGIAPRVSRCVKLNNYWCIKTAGWDGEIAADGEGHVAFASAIEGAAVAALLLKRYYVDFDRHSAMAIISHWAPAQCGLAPDGVLVGGSRRRVARSLAPKGIAGTLRARWLASHSRGFVVPLAGRKAKVRRSVVADHVSRMAPTPTIAIGLGNVRHGETKRPMTLDALLMSSPNAPPSRSMLGMPPRSKSSNAGQIGSVSSCGFDSARVAAYAAKAATGITPGAGGDLALFGSDGTPTKNLSIMLANMARVEIGPFVATPALISEGIAQAFRPGRNPDKS